jgi:hypothetical protein
MADSNENENQIDSAMPTVISTGAGVAAGAVITSGAAVSAAGAGAAGVTGYMAGIGVLAAHVGCEAAAVIGLGTVAAGPIIGGLIGYGVYRSVKSIVSG